MQIGNYEIVEQIGAGAMGVVYKARHLRVRRDHLYALKLMHSVIAGRADLVARFHREIEVVGRLEHPNIVNVVDAGEHEGSPYLVMEYLRGESLEKCISERRPVAFNKKLEIMAAVCRGLAYAHGQGVVHRDVKPANIILLPDLTPRIVDFGVAHIADDTMTKTGVMVGTISYMSPEQLNGSKVDGRSDIFSTSIVLYEFLSNRLPFEGADTAAIMKKILMDAPPPLRTFVEPCPFQIEAILAKGLAKEAGYRYTAAEMATELENLQETELVMEAAADAAMQATVIAPAAARVPKSPVVAPEPPPAPSPVSAAAPAPTRIAAPTVQAAKQETVKVIEPPVPAAKTEIKLPAAELDLQPKRHVPKWLIGIAITVAVLLAIVGILSIAGAPGNMRKLGGSGRFGSVQSVTFDPTGHYMASTAEHDIVLWDLTSWQPVRTLSGHTDDVNSLAFSHDGKQLASASNDKTIKLWDVASGRELRTLTGHVNWVRSVVFSADRHTLASGADDGTIRIWDLDTQGVRILTNNPGASYSLAFSPSGNYLASGSNPKITLWDWFLIRFGTDLGGSHTLEGHSSAVNSLAFSPDGRLLVSASNDDTVKFWDVATGHTLTTWTGWRFSVSAVAFSPDGHFVAAGGIERRIRLWDVTAQREVRKLDDADSYLSAFWLDATHTGPSIESLSFSPDSHYLAAGMSNGRGVELWDITK